MDWNVSHTFVSGRKPSAGDSISAAQSVTQMLNDWNSSKDIKVPPSGRPPTIMAVNQQISQENMNGLKMSPTPVTKPVLQDSLMHMVSMMNPISRGFVQHLTTQGPGFPFEAQKSTSFVNDQPIISVPFIYGTANCEYFQPPNFIPYSIPRQSFLSLYEDNGFHQDNFIDPFYFGCYNPTNFNPLPKKSYKLNPEAAEYIPRTMRVADEESLAGPSSLSIPDNIGIATTPMTDDRHVSTAESQCTKIPAVTESQLHSEPAFQKGSFCEDRPENGSSFEPESERKAELEKPLVVGKVSCHFEPEKVLPPCNVPLSVNFPVQNGKFCDDHSQKKELDASSVTLSRNSLNSIDFTSNESPSDVPSIEKVVLEHCVVPSLECSTKDSSKSTTGASVVCRVCASQPGIGVQERNHKFLNTARGQREPSQNDDDSRSSSDDEEEEEDGSSSNSNNSSSSSSSSIESESDIDHCEDESDYCFSSDEECDVCFKDYDDDPQPVDPTKPISINDLCVCENQKPEGCHTESLSGKLKGRESSQEKSRCMLSHRGRGWAILSYILRSASISEESEESEAEGDPAYDCDVFNLDLDDAWDIPVGGLVASDFVSDCTRNEEVKSKSGDSFSVPGLSDIETLARDFDELDSRENDGDKSRYKMDEELNRVNDKWNAEIDKDWQRSTPRKVEFCDKVQCRPAADCCRRGPWENFARDRMRFRTRIEEIESIVGPVLNPAHRWKVFTKLKRQQLVDK